ncbi:unnamed protein product [Gongylonema pulchrum]|uniref:Phosphomannomutase n=1 Tax=Gongylonema pulchrum TaxID=637853 RepID=A0A183F139_9BILA|nr:unnamed protein product [Gongylonema pulchrum]
MLNLSPIGRSCTLEERLQFVEYDKEHGVRQKFVKKLENFAKGWDLNICIGGQISVDVFPCGWDKTFCLRYLTDFDTIHFFGDKTVVVSRLALFALCTIYAKYCGATSCSCVCVALPLLSGKPASKQ